jgi:hypothetical protein
MRFVLVIFILGFSVPAFAQSRRVAPVPTPVTAIAPDLTFKQMFDEVSAYNKVKFAEYEAKKIAYSERLRLETERGQRQLAAKYATSAGGRSDLTAEDIYYVGLLN